MKPALRRRSSSSFRARRHSAIIFYSLFFTGLASGKVDSLWQMTKGSTLGISVGDHKNISRFSDKNSLNWSFSWLLGELTLGDKGPHETA